MSAIKPFFRSVYQTLAPIGSCFAIVFLSCTLASCSIETHHTPVDLPYATTQIELHPPLGNGASQAPTVLSDQQEIEKFHQWFQTLRVAPLGSYPTTVITAYTHNNGSLNELAKLSFSVGNTVYVMHHNRLHQGRLDQLPATFIRLISTEPTVLAP
jgi:hypothetical protein